ncbi:Protein of unknown function [Polynucleobacter meluiroseus]|uniref:DUF3047 domain-containing protein n=1 Tax=Polynucleobacter meluiroseus TaxID=1938814 RepID=A0A240E3C5_9BURK|nr:DUF3047 domain-containing protein [Polynucleobacter meluiroseus]SNX29434.1 Protein of unknown function [Polynucleobacter meluiroseus]
MSRHPDRPETVLMHWKKAVGCLGVALLFTFSGCAGFSDNTIQDESGQAVNLDQLPAQENLPKFSAGQPGSATPEGWHFYRIAPYKKNTSYRLEGYQGITVLSANAKTSASGLAVKLRPRSAQNLWLKWEWKATTALDRADNADRANDDSPLRILVAFDGNKSKLSLKEKLNFEMANLISGQELPYATLMYIWSGKTPVNTVLNNALTSQVKMIVVDSGWENLGEWRKHERDLASDYQRAYGETPGAVIGIAILTDTDNTKSETRAFYGDMELIRKNAKQ